MMRHLGTRWDNDMQKKGSDKGLVGSKYCFVLLTQVGTNKGPDNVDTG